MFSYMKAVVIERRSIVSRKEDTGIFDYRVLTSWESVHAKALLCARIAISP